MPGPVPKHSSELSRARDADRGDRMPLTKGERRKVTIPHPDSNWHPVAKRLYRALKTSGQADFYQDSDWAYALMLCDDVSVYMSSTRRSGQMAATLYSAMSALLITEADRRRARIELAEPAAEEVPESVAVMDDYRSRLGLSDDA